MVQPDDSVRDRNNEPHAMVSDGIAYEAVDAIGSCKSRARSLPKRRKSASGAGLSKIGDKDMAQSVVTPHQYHDEYFIRTAEITGTPFAPESDRFANSSGRVGSVGAGQNRAVMIAIPIIAARSFGGLDTLHADEPQKITGELPDPRVRNKRQRRTSYPHKNHQFLSLIPADETMKTA